MAVSFSSGHQLKCLYIIVHQLDCCCSAVAGVAWFCCAAPPNSAVSFPNLSLILVLQASFLGERASDGAPGVLLGVAAWIG
jgi:hypothetical protein